MLKFGEKTLKVGPYELKIKELTVEEEAEIKSECRVYDRKTRTYKVDNGALDASIIRYSVIPSSWPDDFGEFTTENIRHLPAKYFRRVLIECQKLNSIPEEVAGFLEQQSSSQASQPKSEQQLELVKHV
jgi:hypothetical protein